MTNLKITYIGGPTALIEMGGVRLLTDPTFDGEGTEYRFAAYALRKTEGPAVAPGEVGAIDIVLLSHDHHRDNFDEGGKLVAARAGRIVTTKAGAGRLRGNAFGLDPWEAADIAAGNRVLRITATPARHGPADGDRGPVIGFVLTFPDQPDAAVYVSGDTVWYEDIAEIARRFRVKLALLFMGAARIPAVGNAALTFTTNGAVSAMRAFASARVMPLHFEGWEHLTESRREITAAFHAAKLDDRLIWPERGHAMRIEL